MSTLNPSDNEPEVPPREDVQGEDDSRSSTPTSIKGSDRVFPIRSALLRAASDSKSLSQRSSAFSSAAPPNDIHSLSESTKPFRNPVRSDTIDSASGESQSFTDQAASSEPDHYVTSRHEYLVTEKGYSIMVGKDKKSLQRCEDEPIRTPGAIQSFGVMIALREEAPNQLVVRVASENSEQVLGYSPNELFELDSFSEILEENEAAKLEEHLEYVRDDTYDIDTDGPEVFLLSISSADGDFNRFWCAAHVSQENKDIIICEFELEDDEINPLNVEDEKNLAPLTSTPISTDTLGITPTPSQLDESTKSSSRSVRSIRNARQRKGEAAAMQIFNTLTPIQEQLDQANDQKTLLEVTAGLVKELVGFHRVLVYQFDSNWNGKVVSELVDPNVTIDLYKGLHFPASDIPSQARELYKVNKVRLLYDRDHTTSRLVCRTLDDLETPVDMTHAYLRAMSPIHTQYLKNMKVRSSMSISINAFGNLWGLISCHSYGEKGMRVSFPLRKLCRVVGDTVARGIERISYASSLQTRKLMEAIPQHTNPSSYIASSSHELLQFLGADYGALSIGGEYKIFGDRINPPDAGLQEARALVDYLRRRQVTSVLISHDIVKDFPDFHLVHKLKNIAGVLCVPLSTSTDQFLVFFRRGQLTTITWAGNPHDIAKHKQTGSKRNMRPRENFKEWVETLLTQSREWTEAEIKTATNFGLVYGKFIQIWNQKDNPKNSRLSNLLLANSAHEVRTPLNAIVNYLEIALEGNLDDETRDSLIKSYSASKSLIYVINDLLELTNMRHEVNERLIKDEPFDLKSTFREATSMLAGEAERRSIVYSSNVHPDLPAIVFGDQRRIRQVFLNLISNAIQHTKSGFVHAEILPTTMENLIDGYVAVEMGVSDTGSGISDARLNKLFEELEGMSEEEINSVENREDLKMKNMERLDDKGVMGLGLALAARMAHNMHGQLLVKSEEGKGSKVRILLQFHRFEQVVPTVQVSRHEDANMSEMPAEPATNVDSTPTGEIIGGDSISEFFADSETTPDTPSDETRSDQVLSSKRKASQETSGGAGNESRTQSDADKSRDSAPSSNSNSKSGSANLSSRGRKSQVSPHSSTDPQTTATPSEGSSSLFSPSTETSTEPSHQSSGKTGSTKLRILVAEDDPVNSAIMSKRLENSGHTVQLASTGDACVNIFSLGPKAFDLILMNIQVRYIWTASCNYLWSLYLLPKIDAYHRRGDCLKNDS